MKRVKIIIGQSDSNVDAALAVLVTYDNFDVHVAGHANQVLEHIKEGASPDLVVLDQSLKNPSAMDICRTLKTDPRSMLVPVLIHMVNESVEDRSLFVQAGCDDIVIAPTPEVFLARVQSLLRLKRLSEDQDDAERVLYQLTRTLEVKDRYTMGHADRVAHFAVDLGRALGVNAFELETLRKGGMLHDIGKIAIPDAILSKPGKYTPDEFAIMKSHPVLGCEICEKLRSVSDALPLIRHHHEKLDGTGYPDGLAGGQIPSLVRVVTIVDIYDALRSQRSYKEAFSIDKSFEIMWDEVGKGWWDRNILSVWEKLVRDTRLPDR
jgi:putative two-component system response regulator